MMMTTMVRNGEVHVGGWVAYDAKAGRLSDVVTSIQAGNFETKITTSNGLVLFASDCFKG